VGGLLRGAAARSGQALGGGSSHLTGVECRWPESLSGGGPAGCHPSGARVSCHDPAGTTCGCSSDGAETCDCSAVVNGGPWTCDYACAPNQYSVSCGAVGPSPEPAADPPAGCTSMVATPAGVAFYCCPCG